MKIDSCCDSCKSINECPNARPRTFYSCDIWQEAKHHTWLDRMLDFYWWRWKK